MIFGLAYLASVVIAANLAMLVAPMDFGGAIGTSLAIGIGFVAMSVSIIALFERRPLSYFLINGGYLVVSFLVMGVILGAWK